MELMRAKDKLAGNRGRESGVPGQREVGYAWKVETETGEASRDGDGSGP